MLNDPWWVETMKRISFRRNIRNEKTGTVSSLAVERLEDRRVLSGTDFGQLSAWTELLRSSVSNSQGREFRDIRAAKLGDVDADGFADHFVMANRVDLSDPSRTDACVGVIIRQNTEPVFRDVTVESLQSLDPNDLNQANPENLTLGSTSVVNRRIFYNRSPSSLFGDGLGNPNNAIDSSKSPLLPGQTTSFANYTNYVRGINGLIVDLAGALPTLTSADFEFAVWDGASSAGFTPTTAIPSVSLIPGGGDSGSNRIKIEFIDNAIRNTWLRISVLANANTGLAAKDVFYFGNAVGDMDAGNVGTPITVRTNATDTSIVRQNQSIAQNSVGVTSIYDLNKDGRVNATDTSIVRQNQSNSIVPFFTAPNPIGGTVYNVATSSQFTAALSSAIAGDTIQMTGNYTGSLSVTGRNYSGAPLTIKATTALATTLSSLTLTNCNNIVVQGFRFGPNTSSTYLKVVNSTNIKILRNLFDHKDISVGQSSIVTSLASDTIEIGYNEFRDKNIGQVGTSKISGSFIKTQYDAPAMTKNLWIHHNHFKNIVPFLVNGIPAGDSDREAIVFGDSGSQDIVTNQIVENNLFEDCDGENEIITVKTSGNTFRFNTFLNSMGSLSLRLGSNQQVYSNYFLGSGASTLVSDSNYQTGGIRVYGNGHKIYNNYMEGLTGTSWRQPILVDNGDTNDSSGGDNHERPTFVEVANNTIVNSAGGIAVGSSNYSLAPQNNKIFNNLVVGSLGAMFTDVAGGPTNTWGSNIAFPSGAAVAVSGAAKTNAQVRTVNPLLNSVVKNGYVIQSLSGASPAIDASTGAFAFLTHDLDGDLRGLADVGADEYSALPTLSNRPLNALDVGTNAT